MTEMELQNEIDQARRDAITLDFSKWRFQQGRLKLSTDHELWQQQRDAVLDRQRRDNAEARARYLNKLEAAKDAKRRERDAEIDRELEPQKQRLKRDWLANNPNFTATDFEQKAWIHLRENLIEELNADATQTAIHQQKQRLSI